MRYEPQWIPSLVALAIGLALLVDAIRPTWPRTLVRWAQRPQVLPWLVGGLIVKLIVVGLLVTL